VKIVLLALALVCATVTRSAAAEFTVTNTNVAGPGSLYHAITDANNAPGADRILFNIPGTGVRTIDVSQNPLPAVVESLVIDGYSQPGAKPNTLSLGDDAVILIQIDGSGSKIPLTGLSLSGITSPRGQYFPAHYTIQGLSLTGFAAQESLPGGYCGPDRVKHSYAIGVGTVYSAVIAGNFIGVLPDGETPLPNDRGIRLPDHPDSTMTVNNTVVGGSDPALRNVISGHSDYGVSGGGMVQGNYIGTNAKGTKAIPNAIGIQADSGMIIGGTTAGARNVISGNVTAVQVGGFNYCMGAVSSVPSDGVRIQGNTIGAQPLASSALPNGSGITIVAGSNNVIGGPGDNGVSGGNGILFNDTGVIVTGGAASQGNRISQNAIFRNRQLGIDLGGDGVTSNDINDADSGPNNFQNYPLIDSVTIVTSPRGASSASVKGTFNSAPNSTFRLEFFISGTITDPSSVGKGELFRGSTDVTTDASGNASFATGFDTDPGRAYFTATATDSSGNTSEFSPAFLVPAPQLVNLSTRSPVGSGDNVLIGGFIIVGTENKKVMLRGLGPSLADAGVNGVLADPTLELHDSSSALLASNNNWKDTQADEVSATGIPPSHDAESAIIATLPAGPPSQGGSTYTGILAGNHGTTGTGLLEIYDLAMDANSKLANISTRGYIGTGEDVLIGGFIPRPAARVSLQLLIRALGPSLAAHGVSGTLQDPLLELHNANGSTIASNDSWRDSPDASRIAATGIPPSDDQESAILHFVPAGTDGGYTAVVRGVDGATGVALVEIYALN